MNHEFYVLVNEVKESRILKVGKRKKVKRKPSLHESHPWSGSSSSAVSSYVPQAWRQNSANECTASNWY